MSTLPGTSCLLTDLDHLPLPTRPTPRPTDYPTPHDPGDDAVRQAHAALTGRPAVQCSVCAVPVGDAFTRRAKSGKVFCTLCAERTVAAYYAQHPESRPRPDRAPRERTGTAYLAERERFAVRHHAGNACYQISDTQARRWTAQRHTTEASAAIAAATMNAAWRSQIERERALFSATILPSTSPVHTWRIGERGYGRDE